MTSCQRFDLAADLIIEYLIEEEVIARLVNPMGVFRWVRVPVLLLASLTNPYALLG